MRTGSFGRLWRGSEAKYAAVPSALQSKSWSLVSTLQFLTRAASVLFVVLLVLVVFVSLRSISSSTLNSTASWSPEEAPLTQYDRHHVHSDRTSKLQPEAQPAQQPKPTPKPQPKPINLNCPSGNPTAPPVCQTRPAPFIRLPQTPRPSASCPDYFRWIHEDLRPWRATGVTKEMVERAQRFATFRLVVLDGRVYVEQYRKAFMTRDVFTIWGFIQLVNRYPGRVPDLDLMFNCDDMPVVKAADYAASPPPPPIFHYDKDDATVDILFPDWSFWGWPEINIGPWEKLVEELKKANKKIKWKDREPYAYWKGNSMMGASRQDLMKCNSSNGQDWNTRLYDTNWIVEVNGGFRDSSLVEQCRHKYKIFIEGLAWSVSEKYILACDSLALFVTTHFHEFFSRSLLPGQHYWPIKEDDKCRLIKSAVDWGNKHQKKAQSMANVGTRFVQEQLKMDYVYDYMLHLLNGYANLLKYKPSVPEKATEICLESMVCPAQGRVKTFMLESMAKWTHEEEPCAMPPPYNEEEFRELHAKKDQAIKQLEAWQKNA